MQENRNITVPKTLEAAVDQVFKEMDIANSKKDIMSSALWPVANETKEESEGKKEPKYVMYTVKINETLAFLAGMKVNQLSK